ncbi:cellulose biosynthesis protein BcsC [Plastoroseomonas arctica]|uniref:Tetratricopeptide repeat protein n=1 Tax=Plastoroseomonas arctica TaxID=1509237 RepID=A0AAF1K0H8_9PROT|nr:cellulose biosynthesis protein BcsC [Plastoroseomonas arctica]MBR0654624.1 tetratricopeptide repeat protein [Plastoroseomonas arctica]
MRILNSAGLALLAGIAATPGLAQPAAGPGVDPIRALVQQGEFWLRQSRFDVALRSFRRVLDVQPDNGAALAGAAQAEAALGNREAAEALTARLRATIQRSDPLLAQTEGALRTAAAGPEQLAEARRLGQAGRTADAARAYRRIFGDGVPPDGFAVEVYSTLAGTPDGRREGMAGLAEQVRRRPNDVRAQLAYAQALSWTPDTRSQGIERLRLLAQQRPPEPALLQAWRQALIWTGPIPEAQREMEAFLAIAPNDPVIAELLAATRDPGRRRDDAAAEARRLGFERLEGSRTRDAVSAFEQALARNPNDADALGGLGVARLREGRARDARDLLGRAMAADPVGAPRWQRAFDGAAYGIDIEEARRQMRTGQMTGAETLLQAAIRRDVTDRSEAQTLLGDILLRRGDNAQAEAQYRAALQSRAGQVEAATGLSRALRAQNRGAEADEVARQIPRSPPGEIAAVPGAAQRAQAARASDPETAMALLRAAIAANPNDPWGRLDLARLLLRQGRGAEARALMEERLDRGGAETLFAAALYAEAEGRSEDAATLIARIPPGARTADMARLVARSRGNAEVDAAANDLAGGSLFVARQRLLAIAARQDPSGAQAAAVIRAFGRANDSRGADEAYRVAIAASRGGLSTAARLTLAGAMLEAGLDQQALALGREVARDPRASADDRRQAEGLQTGAAIRNADRLNRAGDQAGGFDALRPVLTQNPNDPAANAALARLYQGARRPVEAAQVAETVLARDPRNLDARQVAIDAAIQSRDLRRAEALVAEARVLAPSEARVSIMEARVARASGDPRRATQALELATEQRRAATGGDARGVTSVAFSDSGNPFRPRSGAFSPVLPTRDPIGAEIARELAAVQDSSRVTFAAEPNVRARSGTTGLDRLTEISAGIEARGPLAGGDVSVRATPVLADAGSLERDPNTLRRYGGNALAGPGGGTAPRSNSAEGVGFGVQYRREGLVIDAGTTPIGFPRTEFVGGIEISPAIGSNLRIRALAERRAVTDSLLSWAGIRDTQSGRDFGGVIRTGGRAQLEYGQGPVTLYAGGGYSSFSGQGVQDNTRYEAGAGLGYRVWRDEESELTTGVDIAHFGYQRNLRFFTLGHGGYFSPQSYTALTVPLDWRGRSGDLTWRLGASLGFASFREDAAPYFPGNAALQGRLEGAARSDGTLVTQYPSQSQSGVVASVRGDLEYRINQQIRVGGLLRFERTADFNETRGLMYLRYALE